jgi:ribosomal protein S18 acetylase RimI-like enzyme
MARGGNQAKRNSAGCFIVGWCDIAVKKREGFRHVGDLGMGVLKDFRGQGLGRALLEKTLAAAREQKLERVELEVYASNLVAVRLYERHGFQLEGRKQKARKLDGEYDDILVMALLFDSSSTTETF